MTSATTQPVGGTGGRHLEGQGPAYPFWSLSIIAADLVALYGLCAYGSLATRLIAAAQAEAAARGCSQTVHFTYAFQARELYERNGYELIGSVEDFPTGTDVLGYSKRLKGRADRRWIEISFPRAG